MRLSLRTRGGKHTHTQKSHSTKESWRPQVKSYWNTRFGLVFLFSLRSFQVWWSLPNVHMQICKETEVPLWISGISAQSFKQPEISEFIWFKPSLAIPFMHCLTMRMNSVSLSFSYTRFVDDANEKLRPYRTLTPPPEEVFRFTSINILERAKQLIKQNKRKEGRKEDWFQKEWIYADISSYHFFALTIYGAP